MKKSLFIFLICLSMGLRVHASNITIIESLTGNTWAVQDSVWRFVAEGMGHTATIVPQTTLDEYVNLNGTDVLIVSSATISFAGTNHLETIKQFIMSGRSAYIQSEYLISYQGNITFDSIMHAVEADFNWIETISGSLVPMNILGTFATTPNAVSTLSYFNYGYAGTGNGVEKFLEYEGNYFGFCYSETDSDNGTVITISDEDWAWQNKSPELMENILYRLLQTEPVDVEMIMENSTAIQVYPNPFSTTTTLQFNSEMQNADILIFNAQGQMLREIKNISGVTYTLNRNDLPNGLIFMCIMEDGKLIDGRELIITQQ